MTNEDLARKLERTARTYEAEPGRVAYLFAAQREEIARAVAEAVDLPPRACGGSNGSRAE